MAALKEFQLYIEGVGLYTITDSRLYYDEVIEKMFTSDGRAPVSSFNRTAYSDSEISYDVTVDTLLYPKLEEYAEKIQQGLNSAINDKKISYEILKTKGTNPRDLVYFTIDYKYKFEDLEKDLQKAKEEYSNEQLLIEQYNKAVNDGDAKEIERLRQQIEAAQKVEVTPVSSASESELEKKAIGKEEEKKQEGSQQQATIQPPLAPPSKPIIVTPTEKTTVSNTKESSKEKTIIESISSSVFDKKILEYEKASTDRMLATKESKSEKSPVVSTTPATSGILSQSTILKEAQTVERIFSETLPAIIDTSVKTIVPIEISKVLSTVISKDASNIATSILGKEVTDTVKNQISEAGTILSSISETVKLMQDSISSVASTLEDTMVTIESAFTTVAKESSNVVGIATSASNKIESAFTTVAKESSNVVGIATSASNSTSNILNEATVKSEKNTTDRSMISDMERKVIGIETASPIVEELGTLITNIGGVLKNLVTNISEISKTNNTKVAPSSSVTLMNPNNTPTVNNEESSTANMGSQMNQNVFGGTPTFPSVVSLSQSTIDNLASAIIKNMTIAPFLNSGR